MKRHTVYYNNVENTFLMAPYRKGYFQKGPMTRVTTDHEHHDVPEVVAQFALDPGRDDQD